MALSGRDRILGKVPASGKMLLRGGGESALVQRSSQGHRLLVLLDRRSRSVEPRSKRGGERAGGRGGQEAEVGTGIGPRGEGAGQW